MFFLRRTLTPSFSMLLLRIAPAAGSSCVTTQMNHVHLQAEVLQPASGFEPQQPTSNDGRALPPFGVFGDLAAVVQRTEDKHAGFEAAIRHRGTFHLRDEGPAAGGDDEFVVRLRVTILAVDQPHPREQARGAQTRQQVNVVFLVPGEGVEKDFVLPVRSVQDVREENAVVVPRGFVAKHSDVEHIRAAARQDLLHSPRACHPVTDDHQLSFLFHYAISIKPMSRTTEDFTP